MNQRWLLLIAVTAVFSLPFLSLKTGQSMFLLYSFTCFLLLWIQELFIVQLKYRSENVEFTRRFNSKYSEFPFSLAKYTHIGLASIVITYILLIIGYLPDTTGILILVFTFLGLIRVFDPVLGCLSSFEAISWTSMVGYLIVFIFSISSGLDSSKLDVYQLPPQFIQSILLSLVIFTTLNLRMVYYQKFCFLYEQNLESQLRLILIPLLFLSVHQVVSFLDSVDIQAIFVR